MRNNALRRGCLAVTLCAVAGCQTLQQVAEEAARATGDKRLVQTVQGGGTLIAGLLPIGYEEEQAIGQAMALQVVARYGGVYERPELTRYVTLVGRAVALTCDRAEIDYRFAVLDDASINAFATPAGYVFVTRGLLKTVRNEAELAGVLGHEIAHVSRKHMLEVIQRSKQIAGVTEAGLAYASKNPESFKHAVDGAVTKLLDEGLDQGKELESDRLGVLFASRVGYDPTAYAAFLERLKSIKGDDHAFFKTHPEFSARLAAVHAAIADEGLRATGTLLPERFSRAAGGML
jgi:predicted Zn-dependent protease